MDQQEIFEKFKVIRKKQIAGFAIIPIMMAFILVLMFLENSGYFALSNYKDYIFYIFVAGLIFSVLFPFKNWHCPGCGKYLGRNLNPTFCHSCGAKLREDKGR